MKQLGLIELDGYQLAGAERLSNTNKAYLADEQGLSKTYQAIEGALQKKCKLVGVVAKPNVIPVWQEELWEYARIRCRKVNFKEIPTQGWWLIPSSSGSRQHPKSAAAKNFETCLNIKWDLIIVDEAHIVKNPTAGITEAFFGGDLALRQKQGVLKKATATWFLSGTPITNTVKDLYVPLRYLFPEAIEQPNGKPMSFSKFTETFTYENFNSPYASKAIKNVTKLQRIFDKYFIRRIKEETEYKSVAKYSSLKLDLNINQEELEQYIPKDILEGSDDKLIKFLSEQDIPPLQDLGMRKAALMVLKTKNLLTNPDPRKRGKIIYFCYHRTVYELLMRLLHPYGVVGIRGGVSPAKRHRAVKRFQRDPRCRAFVGQIRAASEGITLTEAAATVFVECGYSPHLVAQAACRADRRGQKRKSVPTILVGSNSPLDMRVINIMLSKSKNIMKIVKSRKMDFLG